MGIATRNLPNHVVLVIIQKSPRPSGGRPKAHLARLILRAPPCGLGNLLHYLRRSHTFDVLLRCALPNCRSSGSRRGIKGCTRARICEQRVSGTACFWNRKFLVQWVSLWILTSNATTGCLTIHTSNNPKELHWTFHDPEWNYTLVDAWLSLPLAWFRLRTAIRQREQSKRPSTATLKELSGPLLPL